MTAVHISIVVYTGHPLDYSQYRHTALWLRFADRSPSLLVHVVGPPGEFIFESKESSKPWETQRYAKTVEVGLLRVAATSAQAVAALQRVPVDHRDREFNCQTWVEHALKMLQNAGHLSRESYNPGLEGMVDAIAEAEDTEE